MTNNLNEVARATIAAFAEQDRAKRQRAEAAAERHREAEARRQADDRQARAAAIEMMRTRPATA